MAPTISQVSHLRLSVCEITSIGCHSQAARCAYDEFKGGDETSNSWEEPAEVTPNVD